MRSLLASPREVQIAWFIYFSGASDPAGLVLYPDGKIPRAGDLVKLPLSERRGTVLSVDEKTMSLHVLPEPIPAEEQEPVLEPASESWLTWFLNLGRRKTNVTASSGQ